MEVVAVKYLGDRTSVERERMNGESVETLSLRDCPDPPRNSFLEALEAVRKDVLARIGLGAVFSKATKVTGVKVSTDRYGHRLFSITATVQGKYGPAFGIPFPLLREKVENEEGETVLSTMELKRIDKLLDEAQRYAEGQRVQATLDLDGTGG